MRCKPGDLAIVIRSQVGNLGKIVRVVHWVGAFEVIPGLPYTATCDGWLITAPGLKGIVSNGQIVDLDRGVLPDDALRPLPGDLSEDETENEKELVE